MCFYISLKSTKAELEKNFDATVLESDFIQSDIVNGFAHPNIPIITDIDEYDIVSGTWGLIPYWAKNKTIQKSTLNAKIETLHQTPSFKNSVNKRCLVLVDGFYEWKWLDPKGRNKEKYEIKLDIGNKPFALGGIYSLWTDPETNKQLKTVSIVTTQANELMSEIHNTKNRMPLILTKDFERKWLDHKELESFAFPNYNPILKAELV